MSINDCGLLSTLIIGQTQMDTNETGIKTLRWRQSDGLMDGMKWPSSTRHVLFLAFHNVSHFPQCSYMFISTHLYEWLSNWGCHSMLCLSPLRVRCLVGNRPLSAVWYLNGSYTLHAARVQFIKEASQVEVRAGLTEHMNHWRLETKLLTDRVFQNKDLR